MAKNILDITDDIDEVFTTIKMIGHKNGIKTLKNAQSKLDLSFEILGNILRNIDPKEFERLTTYTK